MPIYLERRTREGWHQERRIDALLSVEDVAHINNGMQADWRLSRTEPQAKPLWQGDCPMPRQEGDENVCSKCGLRWDTHEDAPPCPKYGST